MHTLSFIGLLCFSCMTMAKDFPVPGVNGYRQMIHLLGQPKFVQKTPDGHNYIYPDVVVNVSGQDASIITSMSFNHPRVYTVHQGLDVGMTAKQVLARLSDYYVHQSPDVNFITDYQRGLIFWMERDQVVKLVKVKPGTLKRIR